MYTFTYSQIYRLYDYTGPMSYVVFVSQLLSIGFYLYYVV